MDDPRATALEITVGNHRNARGWPPHLRTYSLVPETPERDRGRAQTWEWNGNGAGIHWPLIDEDLSISGPMVGHVTASRPGIQFPDSKLEDGAITTPRIAWDERGNPRVVPGAIAILECSMAEEGDPCEGEVRGECLCATNIEGCVEDQYDNYCRKHSNYVKQEMAAGRW